MSDILLENINFSYDKELVLKNINLSYSCKDFLVIIGPNGGGKSTLLKLMLGLLKPTNGKIKVFGNEPLKICSQIGYVPQATMANPDFPVEVLEVVLMGLVNKKLFGFYSKNDIQIAMQALKRVGMDEFCKKRIGELSGGQRQRVYIARALVSNSKILMLDEPTSSVDAKTQAEIYTLLRDINAKGIGIVLISHDVNIALSFANKVAYVNHQLFMHDIQPNKKHDFIAHLAKEHSHFCDVEIALRQCECNTNKS